MQHLISEDTLFMSKSDAIRAAIRAMLQRDLDATATGYRLQSTPTEREQAQTILDYLEHELGARNVEWQVVPAMEVQD